MHPLVGLAALVAATAMAAPSLPDPPEGRDPHPSDAAVVIGVQDYFVLPDAPGAQTDALAVRDTLRTTRKIPDDRITLLIDGASRERILAAAKAAGAAAGTGGSAWLYFAGHAVHDPDNGTLHLLGADAQPQAEGLLSRAVTLDELAEALRSGGGRPTFWLDAGSGPDGRSDRDLGLGRPPSAEPVVLDAPKGSIVWTSAPGAGPQGIDGHGAFTYLSVGALRGWADGHGEDPEDGTVTPEEAHRWAADTSAALDVAPPRLLGDTTALAWATGVDADAPALTANDVRTPTIEVDDDGPTDVAASADDILSDARVSLRRMAVGLGGDAPLDVDEVQEGRIRGRSEDEGLAPALAEHLEKTLPPSVTAVHFSAFTSRPPLSARVVTVNFDVELDGVLDAYLVEGVTLPSSPNWPLTAEQIGRKLKEQLANRSAD
jgi:hypothetical protein